MSSTARVMGPACVAARREPFSLPERVLNTMAEASAPSTKRLYTLKWSICLAWCQDRDIEPVTSEVSVVLSFLQEMLDKRLSSTIKVHTAAIAAFRAPIAGRSVGRESVVIQFLRGARRMNPPRPRTVPLCDITTILRALKGPPFEPLQSSSLRVLSLKTALLLALALVKRVGDLQALSVNPILLRGVVQRGLHNRHLWGGRLVLAVHICKVLQPGCPCGAGHSPFCLIAIFRVHLTNIVQAPSFAWSVHKLYWH